MRTARAFCPGHVTGFFEICRGKDLLSTGSRGAGMCLSFGATSEVTVTDSPRRRVRILLDGKESPAAVTREAVARLLGRRTASITVSTAHDLPIGQGFGMSAAGALSATVALASLLGDGRQRAFEAAHEAEIVKGGGLGDVSAIHRGGITVRERPGLPPRGKVRRIDGAPQVLLCVVGRPIRTRSVLSDAAAIRAINASGGRKVDELMRRPSMERLVELSAEFMVESGLATRAVARAVEAASDHGAASMSMLGNSVFAVGDIDALEVALARHGETYRCRVDVRGPRLVWPRATGPSRA